MAADTDDTLPEWSTTESSNKPSGPTTVGTNWDDNLRMMQKVVRGWLASKGADIASATTTDLGAVEGFSHDITGTTTITGFGTVSAGIHKVLKFEGALTLTHNATSLILPGAANITTADGDVGWFESEGSGNWRCLMYMPATGSLPFVDSSAVVIGSADKTKKVRIEADGITTATTRVITMPDADVTLGLGAASGVGQTFLGGDVALNNTANYFNVCNTGAIGASGQVWLIHAVCQFVDTAGAAAFRARVWDGSATVYCESQVNSSGANASVIATIMAVVSLSGATTFHLSGKDVTSTSGVAQTSSGGTANKATSITAIRMV